MQLATKKCLLSYSGAIMFAFGFALILEGNYYFSNPERALFGGNVTVHPIVRAVPHWCGILLILLGARNFTFGLAQWKYGMNCCGGGACEVVFVNLVSLLVSLAAAGLPVYGSWNFLNNVDASSVGAYAELVYLVSIFFMGLVSAILSLLSMCAGCLPIDGSSEEEGIEMQDYGRDNPQFSKY